MPKRPRLNGIVVLVVDDSPDTLYLVELLLVRQGANVVTAGSATEALRIVEKTPPDVILSDIGMPEMDGYMLIKKIRELERKKNQDAHIPAAAVTAFTSTADRQKAILAGYQIHIPKPIDVEELLTTVARLAGRTEKHFSGDQV